MTLNDDTRAEVRRLAKLLKGIADMAEGASISGSLSGGSTVAVRRYNAVVQRLAALDVIKPELFQPLAEGASFDEVGVESGLLARYLKDFDQDEERWGWKNSWGPDNNVVVSLGGLKDLKDLNDLRDLGRVIREQLPGWMRGRGWEWCESGAREAKAETKPLDTAEIDRRLAEISTHLQMVMEQLQRTDLSDNLRAEIAEQLARLSQEQADLARKRAGMQERQ